MTWIMPVSSKGQVTLPLALRQFLGVKEGLDRVVFEKKRNRVVVMPTKGTLYDLKGILSTHPKRHVPWEIVREQARKARAAHIASNG